MGLSAVVKPLLIESRFGQFDLPIVLAVAALLAVFLLITGRIGQVAGGVMAVSCVIFTVAQYSGIIEELARA